MLDKLILEIMQVLISSMKTEGQGIDILENTSDVHNRLPRPMIQSIFSGFQEKVQECVKVCSSLFNMLFDVYMIYIYSQIFFVAAVKFQKIENRS